MLHARCVLLYRSVNPWNKKSIGHPGGKRSVRERELEAVVAQFLSLASKAQDLLPSNNKNKNENPPCSKTTPTIFKGTKEESKRWNRIRPIKKRPLTAAFKISTISLESLKASRP